MAETGSMVENLKHGLHGFFHTLYRLVTAATATGLIKARSVLLESTSGTSTGVPQEAS